MIRSASDFILGVWNAPEVPLRVEYPLEIMEELRALVCDDLQRLSRGGTDAAGLLFGVTRGPVIRILAWREISRSSPEEQAARLALHDRAELVRVLSGAATDPAMRGMEPLGWFVSRVQGGTGLTVPEVELYNNFFPNPWQVTLLLRRAPGGTSRAGFFVREPGGFLRPDASYRELLIQPLRRMPRALVPSARPEVSPVQDAQQRHAGIQHDNRAAGQPVAVTPVAPEAPAVAPETAAIAPEAAPVVFEAAVVAPHATSQLTEAAVPVESSNEQQNSGTTPPAETAIALEPSSNDPTPPNRVRMATTVERAPAEKPGEPAPHPLAQRHSPAFPATPIKAPSPARVSATTQPPQPETSEPSPETPSFFLQTHSFGGTRWLWILLVLLALAAVVFLFMQKTAPASLPSFSLRVAAVGDMVEISWDRDSIPVYKSEHASIKIQDGADTKQISLNSEQLHAGKTHYVRETGDVALLMTIYDKGSQEFQEFARLVAAPADAASLSPAPQSADASQLRAERDDLQTQVRQLKEQVRKEAARADQAESVVKILENRLKIRPNDEKK